MKGTMKKKTGNKETLYARIERVNKLYIEELAHTKRMSEAFVVNHIINLYRKTKSESTLDTTKRRLQTA